MTNLLEAIAQNDSLKTLQEAINVTELASDLSGSDWVTILAPTDEAFAKLPAGTTKALMLDIPKLKKILLYHVLPGDVRSDDLAQIDEAPTLEGSVIAVENSQGITVNGTTVKQLDILADNGVIHTINSVLVPAMVAGH